MVSLKPALLFFRSRAGAIILIAFGLAALAWWAGSALHDRGVQHERGARALADQKAVEQDHKDYAAAVEWGSQVSQKLAETQRKLNETKVEYLAYANSITGVCDPSFVMFLERVSGAKDGAAVAASPPDDGPFAEAALERAYQEAVARIAGQNIAENFSRLDSCVAEKRAINQWYRRPKEAVSE